jgi:D-alanyl-D-alanine carboxypeptidase
MRFALWATLVGALVVPAVSAASVRPLSAAERAEVISAKEWHSGCPVGLSQLRVLTANYLGFDGKTHTGQLLVNGAYADRLQQVFARLYAIHFPIRHMALSDTYGPIAGRPHDDDITASFECRQAAASPCNGLGNKRTGSWSEHAYGEAIDLNPVENPYVGCGMTRDRTALSYLDRSRGRPGMVTPQVIQFFQDIGWGWGGSWTGSTKDYMHFSATGH